VYPLKSSHRVINFSIWFGIHRFLIRGTKNFYVKVKKTLKYQIATVLCELPYSNSIGVFLNRLRGSCSYSTSGESRIETMSSAE
jgi:ABC-type polysaccharide transport system permease subunit